MTPRGERVERPNLSDDLALRVRELIEVGAYGRGDRLPSIAEMSRRFGVAHPTLREALRKLETVGVVEIRHGSGVYVVKENDPIVVGNPMFGGRVTQRVLLDLVESRVPLEAKAARLAAVRATGGHVRRLRQLLSRSEERLGDGVGLGACNLAFHLEIAQASGNVVLHQILEVLGGVIQEEQHVLLDRREVRERFHMEHLEILAAIEARDPAQAAGRMEAHLENVRQILEQLDSPRSLP